MRDIDTSASKKVINTKNFMPFGQKSLAQMAPDEPRTSGHENPF